MYQRVKIKFLEGILSKSAQVSSIIPSPPDDGRQNEGLNQGLCERELNFLHNSGYVTHYPNVHFFSETYVVKQMEKNILLFFVLTQSRLDYRPEVKCTLRSPPEIMVLIEE